MSKEINLNEIFAELNSNQQKKILRLVSKFRNKNKDAKSGPLDNEDMDDDDESLDDKPLGEIEVLHGDPKPILKKKGSPIFKPKGQSVAGVQKKAKKLPKAGGRGKLSAEGGIQARNLGPIDTSGGRKNLFDPNKVKPSNEYTARDQKLDRKYRNKVTARGERDNNLVEVECSDCGKTEIVNANMVSGDNYTCNNCIRVGGSRGE